jgi:hypothetical protein
MKKFLLISSILLVLGLLIVGLATPIFAHSPDGGGATPADEEVWAAMHKACENGDWAAMVKAAEEVHGEDFDAMPHHDETAYSHTNHRGSMGGHMGGGMMGW